MIKKLFLLCIVIQSFIQASYASVEVTRSLEDSVWPEVNYHGYLKVNRPDGEIFYWYFPSRNSISTDPWILWLTGGPGCGSEIAIFYENGPFLIKDDKLVKNEYGWNNNANLIYIDNPLGAGLSFPGKFFIN